MIAHDVSKVLIHYIIGQLDIFICCFKSPNTLYDWFIQYFDMAMYVYNACEQCAFWIKGMCMRVPIHCHIRICRVSPTNASKYIHVKVFVVFWKNNIRFFFLTCLESKRTTNNEEASSCIPFSACKLGFRLKTVILHEILISTIFPLLGLHLGLHCILCATPTSCSQPANSKFC